MAKKRAVKRKKAANKSKYFDNLHYLGILVIVAIVAIVYLVTNGGTGDSTMEEGEPVTAEDGVELSGEGDLSGQAYSETFSEYCLCFAQMGI